MVAPGAKTDMVALYVPSDSPVGFTEAVMTPGVRVLETVAVNHAALVVVIAQVVDAPPALMLTVWGLGVVPGAAAKTRLEGEATNVAGLWIAAT